MLLFPWLVMHTRNSRILKYTVVAIAKEDPLSTVGKDSKESEYIVLQKINKYRC